MLFVIIEHFKNADPKPIRERFLRDGRMTPDDVIYHASWIDAKNARCFQVMEATSMERLAEWTRHWDDLIDFDIVPVATSQEYWSQIE